MFVKSISSIYLLRIYQSTYYFLHFRAFHNREFLFRANFFRANLSDKKNFRVLLFLRYILSITSIYVRVHFYFTTYKKVFSKIFTRIQSYYIRKCDFQKKKIYGSFLVRIFPIRVNIFRAVRTRNTRRQYDRQLTARIITFFYKKMLYL